MPELLSLFVNHKSFVTVLICGAQVAMLAAPQQLCEIQMPVFPLELAIQSCSLISHVVSCANLITH